MVSKDDAGEYFAHLHEWKELTLTDLSASGRSTYA